jgi:peptide deformylase
VGIGQSFVVYDIAAKRGRPRSARAGQSEDRITSEGEMHFGKRGLPERARFQGGRQTGRTYSCGRSSTGMATRLRFEAEGLLAIVIQHELDHLNGTLFIDHISTLKRQMYKRRVKKEMKQQ